MAVGTLNVELCGASGLKNTEFIGKSDPYVVLSIGKTERKSKAANDQATAPTWNEKFTLPVVDTDTELLIRILNDNTLAKDDEIGRTIIPLSEVHGGSHSATTFTVQCKGKPQGELKLNLKFDSESHHKGGEKSLLEKVEGLGLGSGKHHKEERHEEEHGKKEHKEDHREEEHEKEGVIDKIKEKVEDLKKSEEKKSQKKSEDSEEKKKRKIKSKRPDKEEKNDEEEKEESSSSSESESESDEEEN